MTSTVEEYLAEAMSWRMSWISGRVYPSFSVILLRARPLTWGVWLSHAHIVKTLHFVAVWTFPSTRIHAGFGGVIEEIPGTAGAQGGEVICVEPVDIQTSTDMLDLVGPWRGSGYSGCTRRRSYFRGTCGHPNQHRYAGFGGSMTRFRVQRVHKAEEFAWNLWTSKPAPICWIWWVHDQVPDTAGAQGGGVCVEPVVIQTSTDMLDLVGPMTRFRVQRVHKTEKLFPWNLWTSKPAPICWIWWVHGEVPGTAGAQGGGVCVEPVDIQTSTDMLDLVGPMTRFRVQRVHKAELFVWNQWTSKPAPICWIWWVHGEVPDTAGAQGGGVCVEPVVIQTSTDMLDLVGPMTRFRVQRVHKTEKLFPWNLWTSKPAPICWIWWVHGEVPGTAGAQGGGVCVEPVDIQTSTDMLDLVGP
ncbi:Retrotransposable element Tf2 155 kDa protein type 1 [Ceratocystis lukuohia]|uniref:Retrotransposable element Tf2 155 kDa protein type 1 n=1 Tax=Ceratocystis lukuohia TaxID=2019550 RepID=A0ABR4MGC8_9PEZI